MHRPAWLALMPLVFPLLLPTLFFSSSDAAEVLWDISHGLYASGHPYGDFSELAAALPDFTFSITETEIHLIDLSQYQVLVFSIGSTYDSPYTPVEIEAAQQFVAGGGAILVLGDNALVWPHHINPMSEAFGATTGVTTLSPPDLYFSFFAPLPLFDGIDELYFRVGGELSVLPPSLAVAWTDVGAQPTIAVSHVPCVVTIGDNSMLSNAYIDTADNRAFGVGLFHWLRDCGGATPIEPSTWGSIKAVHR